MLPSVISLTTLGAILVSSVVGSAIDPRALHDKSRERYTHAHSLGADYNFDARDGWSSLNVTDMQYKYSRPPTPRGNRVLDGAAHRLQSGNAPSKHVSHKTRSVTHGVLFGDQLFGGSAASDATASDSTVHDSTSGNTGTAGGALDTLSDAFKAVGSAEDVVITWYTGHDLDNPSCWSDTVWTPTDASFVAALTLEGWSSKPQCFKFLELCNGPTKCVFVRVVDTCAGCAAGSRHVDMTRSAFSTIADLNLGVLNVQMRPASDPSGPWHQDLWGPKVHGN